jgi:hypothetical protein
MVGLSQGHTWLQVRRRHNLIFRIQVMLINVYLGLVLFIFIHRKFDKSPQSKMFGTQEVEAVNG